jgi:hypothetical protein
MPAKKQVRKPSVHVARIFGFRFGAASILVAVAGGALAPRTALAQCAGGASCCVDLEFRNVPLVAYVGETFSVPVYAKSTNGFNQSIIFMDMIINWDPTKLRLIGRQNPCTNIDSCFDCASLGLPDPTYNWLLSLFPRDEESDRLNADCGADTFCSPYTGIPFNDGNAIYHAEKQLTCGGNPAPPAVVPPGGLWITSLRFQVLTTGSTSVSMVPQASCAQRPLRCHNVLDPDFALDPCTTDANCVENGLCAGGSNALQPCTASVQCPGGTCKFRTCIGDPGVNGLPCSVNEDCGLGGLCQAHCTACLANNCCTTDEVDEVCNICSFASTRVVGGSIGVETTCNLGPAATINLSNCAPPTVTVAGPRYLAVTPAATGGSIALFVQGTDTGVSCVASYVRNDGVLISQPFYQPPTGSPGWNTIFVRGTKLIAGKNFTVRADCDANSPGSSLSSGVTVKTWRWADVDNNNIIDILDITRILDAFRNTFHTLPCSNDQDCVNVLPHRKCDLGLGRCLWTTLQNVDLVSDANCQPEGIISILDVTVALDAFRSAPNPCGNACP